MAQNGQLQRQQERCGPGAANVSSSLPSDGRPAAVPVERWLCRRHLGVGGKCFGVGSAT